MKNDAVTKWQMREGLDLLIADSKPWNPGCHLERIVDAIHALIEQSEDATGEIPGEKPERSPCCGAEIVWIWTSFDPYDPYPPTKYPVCSKCHKCVPENSHEPVKDGKEGEDD